MNFHCMCLAADYPYSTRCLPYPKHYIRNYPTLWCGRVDLTEVPRQFKRFEFPKDIGNRNEFNRSLIVALSPNDTSLLIRFDTSAVMNDPMYSLQRKRLLIIDKLSFNIFT